MHPLKLPPTRNSYADTRLSGGVGETRAKIELRIVTYVFKYMQTLNRRP